MTPGDRWIALDGAANARDLGGLPVRGGGTTAPGVIIRSDNLQGLTPVDVERLVDGCGVRRVVDLRTSVEVELEGPGPLSAEPRVTIAHRSLHPETGDRTDLGADALIGAAHSARVRDEKPGRQSRFQPPPKKRPRRPARVLARYSGAPGS